MYRTKIELHRSAIDGYELFKFQNSSVPERIVNSMALYETLLSYKELFPEVSYVEMLHRLLGAHPKKGEIDSLNLINVSSLRDRFFRKVFKTIRIRRNSTQGEW
jgi:hypothetical protein